MQTDPEALLRVTLESIRDAVVFTDEDARILAWNAAAASMTGWAEAAVLNKRIDDVIDLREYGTDSPRQNPVHAALQNNLIVHSPGHCLLIGQDSRRVSVHLAATPIHDPQGQVHGCLLVFYDASEALRLAERISYLAQHDPLTGLPNRILLVDRLEQATRLADRTHDFVAVIFLDLDHFHQLNEQFGHAAADEYLKEIAYRLTDALRETDTVCRLGGDEFVLLLPNVRSLSTVETLIAKLQHEVGLPYDVDGAQLQSSCSMGISVYPRDSNDGETLMQLADGAMHKAKQQGRNQAVYARTEISATVQSAQSGDSRA